MTRLIFLRIILAPIAFLAAVPATAARAEDPEAKRTSSQDVVHVDSAKARELLETARKEDPKSESSDPIVVLDLRTPDEFAEGHIKEARNVDFLESTFEEELGKLDRSKRYLVHCRSGGRSGRSLETFRKLGFERIIHLDGGLAAWEEAGFETVKD